MQKLTYLPSRPQLTVPYRAFHKWVVSGAMPWAEFFRTNHGYLLRFPSLADFTISTDTLEVACTPAAGVSEGTVRHLYRNQVWPLIQSKLGRLAIHASAVEVNSQAVVFVGASGRGKSTLAASFAVSGFPFLADDVVIVESTAGAHRVLSNQPSIRLWQDSESALMPQSVIRALASQDYDKCCFLAGEEMPFCTDGRPLLRVYFLQLCNSSSVHIRPLGATEAMKEWIKHSFLLDVEDKLDLASHFEQVVELANRSVHYSLDYPRRFEKLSTVREAILRHAFEEAGVK